MVPKLFNVIPSFCLLRNLQANCHKLQSVYLSIALTPCPLLGTPPERGGHDRKNPLLVQAFPETFSASRQVARSRSPVQLSCYLFTSFMTSRQQVRPQFLPCYPYWEKLLISASLATCSSHFKLVTRESRKVGQIRKLHTVSPVMVNCSLETTCFVLPLLGAFGM